MISKENSALIFDPKFFVKLEIYKQTRILLFHLKNMKYSTVLPMSLSFDNMRFFFSDAQEVKGCDFS